MIPNTFTFSSDKFMALKRRIKELEYRFSADELATGVVKEVTSLIDVDDMYAIEYNFRLDDMRDLEQLQLELLEYTGMDWNDYNEEGEFDNLPQESVDDESLYGGRVSSPKSKKFRG